MKREIPIVVEFIPGTRLHQTHVAANEEVQTKVIFRNGEEVSLPTDQIVMTDAASSEEGGPGVQVGFGGMSFEGISEDQLVLWRVQELWPEEKLSPTRPDRMTLDLSMVSRVYVQGNPVWPRNARLQPGA